MIMICMYNVYDSSYIYLALFMMEGVPNQLVPLTLSAGHQRDERHKVLRHDSPGTLGNSCDKMATIEYLKYDGSKWAKSVCISTIICCPDVHMNT